MKSWIAVAVCLLINGVAMHRAFGQQTTVHTHTSSGFLGVGVAEIDSDRAKALKLKDEHGVVVMNVGGDSPAAKAGLKESDVILEFNGQRVEGVEQFVRLVRETPSGRKINLLVSRNGAIQTISPTLVSHNTQHQDRNFEVRIPDMAEIPWPEMPEAPTPPEPPSGMFVAPRVELLWPDTAIGIETLTLNGQLADYFGVKEGVLVRSVAANSPAEKAGIKAGDVVTRVGTNPVRTAHEISQEVRAQRAAKSPIALTVTRNHKELSFSVKPAEGWQKADRTGDN